MFYCKKWMVNGLIIFTICLQITALPDINKLKTNQSKRKQTTFSSKTNRKFIHKLNQNSAIPIFNIQQSTGALPVVKQTIHPIPQPVQSTPFGNHQVPQSIQPTPFSNHPILQPIQPTTFTNLPISQTTNHHLPTQSFSNSNNHVNHLIEHVTPIITDQPTIESNYNYEYAVHNQHTGDFKQHRESRQNGNVEGYYSLIEPNGRKRVVHYNSNKVNGFQATVKYENINNIPVSTVTNNLDSRQQNNQQFIQQIHEQYPQTFVSIHTPTFSYKY